MTTIAKHVKDNFAGMLVIGDVHADYHAFLNAVNFAERRDLFLMSLGDLVDRGNNPYETVEHMFRLMNNSNAGFIIGNHDDKFRRFHQGRKVSLSNNAKKTLEDVGLERRDEFLNMYVAIVEMPMLSSVFHKFDDIYLAHAASHPAMWENPGNIGDTARSRAFYGETNNEKHSDGLPVRLYNWIDEIPIGKTIIVGHDHRPVFNEPISAPLIKNNPNGGRAIFIDTGCGKGGFLSGVVVLHNKGHFEIDHYVELK